MRANKYNHEFIKSKLENVKKEFDGSRNSDLSSIHDIPPDIDLTRYHDVYKLKKDFKVHELFPKHRIISEHYDSAIIAVELTDNIIDELLKDDVITSVYCETETSEQDIYRPNIIFLECLYSEHFKISLEMHLRRRFRHCLVRQLNLDKPKKL